MQPEPFTVAPLAGIVNQDGVVDTVGGVVDLVRRAGINNADQVAVGDDAVFLFIDRDRAAEVAVHRVATQQAGTLGQVVITTLAHDDGPQPELVATPDFVHQDSCQQPADTAKAVKDDIAWFAEQ